MIDDSFEKVKDIFVKRLGVDREDIRLDSRLEEDLNVDSLFIMELAADIDRIFDIKIPDHALDSIETVEDVLHLLKN